MQRLVFEQDYVLPVARVFAYLAEHENLATLFGTRVERLADGSDGNRNGVGSQRKLSFGGALPFVETIDAYSENEHIGYLITKGSPLNDHRGDMRFSSTPSGSHLRYEIRFRTAVPGLEKVIAAGLRRSIAKGLKKVQAAAA